MYKKRQEAEKASTMKEKKIQINFLTQVTSSKVISRLEKSSFTLDLNKINRNKKIYNNASQFNFSMHLLLAIINAERGDKKLTNSLHKFTRCIAGQNVTDTDQQYPRVLVDAFLGEVDLERKT
jgi:hypothetical protein